jgi:hypothetical protein
VAAVAAARDAVSAGAGGLAGVNIGLRSLLTAGLPLAAGLPCSLSAGAAGAGRADPPFALPTVSAGSGAAASSAVESVAS